MAYMVMGEGGEMTPVTPQPSTQVVAIDNGDGTQQFAIPVMDPETGQENYIVIDPETAANITNGSAEVVTSGNQLMVVNTGTGTAEVLTTGAGLQETEAQPAEAAVMEAGEVEAGVMVMLPSGEQGLVVTGPEDLEGLTMAQPQSDQQLVTEYTDTSVKTETGINGITELQKPKLSNSSMIKIVGIQDKRPTSQISLSKGGNIAVDMPSPYHIDTEVNSSEEAGVSNTVDIVMDGNIATDKEEGGDTAEKEEGGDTADKEEGGDTVDEEGRDTADGEEGGDTVDEEGRGTSDEEGGGTVDEEAGYDTMNKEEPRTLRNILEWYEKWMTETGGDEDKLK